MTASTTAYLSSQRSLSERMMKPGVITLRVNITCRNIHVILTQVRPDVRLHALELNHLIMTSTILNLLTECRSIVRTWDRVAGVVRTTTNASILTTALTTSLTRSCLEKSKVSLLLAQKRATPGTTLSALLSCVLKIRTTEIRLLPKPVLTPTFGLAEGFVPPEIVIFLHHTLLNTSSDRVVSPAVFAELQEFFVNQRYAYPFYTTSYFSSS